MPVLFYSFPYLSLSEDIVWVFKNNFLIKIFGLSCNVIKIIVFQISHFFSHESCYQFCVEITRGNCLEFGQIRPR